MADVIPKDKENHKLSERVRGNLGKNTIQLVDKSQNADAGAYVDNVALYEIIVWWIWNKQILSKNNLKINPYFHKTFEIIN